MIATMIFRPRTAKVVHPPVEDGDCMECHTPHAGKFKGLLKKSVKDTCAGCHDDIPAKTAKVIHQPVADGECLECHDPTWQQDQGVVEEAGEGNLRELPR